MRRERENAGKESCSALMRASSPGRVRFCRNLQPLSRIKIYPLLGAMRPLREKIRMPGADIFFEIRTFCVFSRAYLIFLQVC